MTNRTTTYHFVAVPVIAIPLFNRVAKKTSFTKEMSQTITGSIKPNWREIVKYLLKGYLLQETHRTNKNGQCLGTPNTKQYRDPITGKFAKHPDVKVAQS